MGEKERERGMRKRENIVMANRKKKAELMTKVGS